MIRPHRGLRVFAHVRRWLGLPLPPRAEVGGNELRRLWTRPVRLVLAGQVILGLAIATTVGLLVVHLHDCALADAAQELCTKSLLLAEQAERAFEAVELVQKAILEQLQHEVLRTPDDFRRVSSGSAVHEELRNRAGTLPQLEVISLIDADGNLLNFSRPWPVPRINVADRDYFKALQAAVDQAVFISAPVLNRASGSWMIYLVRQVAAPDHTFLGLILAAVPLDYFEQLYRQAAGGPDSAISMFRGDGVLLARYPHSDGQIGQPYGQALAFQQQATAATRNIIVRKVSEVDGRERLVAATSLLHHAVGVNATDSISGILTQWRKQAAYQISAGGMLEIVTAVVGLLMLRQLHSQRLLNEARIAKAEAESALSIAQEQERTDREFQVQNTRFAAALSNMSQALCMFHSDGRLVMANSRLAELFDLPAVDVTPGMSIDILLRTASTALSERSEDLEVTYASIQRMRAAGTRSGCVQEMEDGRVLSVTFVPVADNGGLVTLEDITEQRMAQARISHMAHHDALTGLPNRVLFHERLSEAVERSHRGEPTAVLYLDLDHFKSVNDTLGHPVGDALLRSVTQRLKHHVRETDTVARLGGDEFAIVQSGMNHPQDVTVLAERLINALGEPYEIDGHHVLIGTSIGIAIAPLNGSDPDQILKNADMALYRAKAEGRSRCCFFEPGMDARVQARRLLEIDLRRALLAEEFALFYQPLMNIRSNSVVGFEALLRWFHPERGLVQPSEFIPLAEEIGLLVPLGRWVLRRACSDAATWPAGIKVAVNVSVTQFGGRTLIEDITSALRDSGLPPVSLELEITEVRYARGHRQRTPDPKSNSGSRYRHRLG